MMTPGLEALILEGKAEWFSYSIGGSGVGSIPFPNNAAYMVVVDFLWNPFTDVETILTQDMFRLAQKTIHTLSLDNGEKKTYFNFRDIVYKNVRPPAENFPQGLPEFQSPTVINCFLTSKKDIAVNILNFTRSPFITWGFSAVPAAPTQEKFDPNGYARMDAVRTTSTPAAVINAMGVNRDPASNVPGSPFMKNEFVDGITIDTRLENPAVIANENLNAHFYFPLVTFGVVAVNKTPTSKNR